MVLSYGESTLFPGIFPWKRKEEKGKSSGNKVEIFGEFVCFGLKVGGQNCTFVH